MDKTIPSEELNSGRWIPLVDYATKNGVSLSTLRRHIKAQKLPYKIEDGRYLLWDKETNNQDNTQRSKQFTDELQRMAFELKRAQEEIAELKTLIALYEENIPKQRIDN